MDFAMRTIALPPRHSNPDFARFIRTCLVLALSNLLGCDNPPPNPNKIEKTRVVATVYPLADIARQVGGPFVEDSWIVESGQSLTGVQSTPDLRARMGSAQLILSNGVADAWASEALSNPSERQRIVRLDLLASAKQVPVVGLLWLDPVLVQDLGRELAGRFLLNHPDREKYFNERADALAGQLDTLIREYQPKFLDVRNRKVLVISSDYNPLLYRFGLEPVQPVDALFMSLSDSQVAVLKLTAKQRGTTVLLVPHDLPKVVAQDISFRTGLQLVMIDSLGGSGQGGHDYLGLMRYNLDQLLQATSFQ
jgi:ABC-type Zn uptake system ZnuABC Zn-binding protein ZnuA